VYQDLKGSGLEIVAVAQDTGGEAAAGRFYDAAKATFTALIDVHHTVSSLYNMVNVPTAVWIDEEGRILRHDEDAYSKSYAFGSTKFGNDVYRPAIYDWVKNGAQSRYVGDREAVLARIPKRGEAEALAEATFKLGVFFFLQGDRERANRLWDEAQKLNPDSWNYHRQDWSFLERDETTRNWLAKFRALGDKPYYRPLDLPAPEPAP
jgi:tetratricopeptide (TPR) repeat protein